MSLETIISIGSKIRKELPKEESLPHHRFIKRAPQYTDKQPYSYYEIDVNNNFNIEINTLKEITDEAIIASKYFYLKFKTGEADSLVKYVFGDIAFPEFFKLDDPTNGAAAFRLNSFLRGKDDAFKIGNEKLNAFRKSLDASLDSLLDLFREKQFCYVHFNFNGKSWFDTEVFNDVENTIISNLIKEEGGNISLQAFLTRTIAESSGRLPDFELSNSYKTKLFYDIQSVKDLLYGLDFQQKSKINVGKDIMINMLPKGQLDAKGVIAYFDKKSNYDFKNSTPESTDPFSEPFINPEIEGIEKYDIIFSKRSKPIGLDLLEITDVNQNLLQRVTDKIASVKKELDYRYTMDFAIKVLLDDKKYNSHLLKIIPLIYKDNYYSDPILLPALLQKTESGIRNGDSKLSFNYIKQHFYFFSNLQKNDTIMEIRKSKSYLAGTKLGQMSKPISQVIKSFEKSYVGNISRRISNVDDLIEFSNYLNEKLMIHEKGYPNIKEASRELASLIDIFPKEEKYNKNYCALGFFETYYTYFKSDTKEDETSAEASENINN